VSATPQGASSVGRVKPRRGNKPKEGTGGPSVARPADRPGLVGGARPWSRPADTPERVSTDGEGTTESPGIPRIRGGPESHRANESSVVHREPETASGSERRSSRTFPRKRGDSCGVSASPARESVESPTKTAPRGEPSVGVRNRRSSRAPGNGKRADAGPSTPAGSCWKRNKRRDRQPRRGTRRPPGVHSCIEGRNEASSRDGRKSRVREAMNGRRGAARSDAGRLPTRTKPSQGGAPRDPPRPIRREPQGTLTIDAGPTWRTPDPVPAATRREARTEEPVEVVRTHEDGTSDRSGILAPKPSAVSSERNRRTKAGVDVHADIGRGEPKR